MKRLSLILPLIAAVAVCGWGVEVNKAGTNGAFTTIQAAIDSGATSITITDSSTYDENVRIGTTSGRGTPITLTSTKTGDQRPVLQSTTPSPVYVNARNDVNRATLGVLSDGCLISNLIVEGNPMFQDGGGGQNGQAALLVMADNVTFENCLFRPMPNDGSSTDLRIKFPNSLIFVAMEGNPSSHVATPNGKTSNGLVFRNCEMRAIHKNASSEMSADGSDKGFLGTGINSTADSLARCDHYTEAGQDCTVLFENCKLLYCFDAGLFPSNRDKDPRQGLGSVTWITRNCVFDGFGKFAFRGRGANVVVECCVFSRTNQGPHGDGENSAVAIQTQDGRNNITASVSNSLFVNCGGAWGKKSYYGGCNNHNGALMTVDHCTFVACLNGIGVGSDGAATAATQVQVSNCIFHQIGYNIPGAADGFGELITQDHPDNTSPGLYPAWDFLIDHADGNYKWAAVFSHINDNPSTITIANCLVGDIASEDTRSWADAQAAGDVVGARLAAGFTEEGEGIVGINNITRATPIFANTDMNAERPYELASNSPGQGLGRDYSVCTSINDWCLF